MGSIELGVMAGIALAAACGLRAFLPLLAIGLMARFGPIRLEPSFAWLASDAALIALAAAAILEMLGDKIPVVDHLLDFLGSAIRPAAGIIAVLGVLPKLPPLIAAVIALAAGGGALGVHAMKAKARLGSTVLTLGHGNAIMSIVEDFVTVSLVLAALLAPIIAFILIVPLVALGVGRRPKRRAA
jgi:hypothetical protein